MLRAAVKRSIVFFAMVIKKNALKRVSSCLGFESRESRPAECYREPMASQGICDSLSATPQNGPATRVAGRHEGQTNGG